MASATIADSGAGVWQPAAAPAALDAQACDTAAGVAAADGPKQKVADGGTASCGPSLRATVRHLAALCFEQLAAIVPIMVLLLSVMSIYFKRTIDNPVTAASGLLAAMIGLVVFLESLRVCVMPLSDYIGELCPRAMPLGGTLVLMFGLGILVTYAEPSIQSLSPLGRLIDPTTSPYLFYMLTDYLSNLILAVGVGVGAAAVLGTLRFLRGWHYKPVLLGALAPTLALSLYMHLVNPAMRPLLGLAWDCGAITTGSVSVPVLLALGTGIAKSNGGGANEGQANGMKPAPSSRLVGFGLVSLASLLPILCVQALSLYVVNNVGTDYIIALADARATAAGTDAGVSGHQRRLAAPDSASSSSDSPSPTLLLSTAALSAARSVLPLLCALVLIIVVLARAPLPHLSFLVQLGRDDKHAMPKQSDVAGAAAPALPAPPAAPRLTPWDTRRADVGLFLLASAACVLGMTLFNVGITLGFTNVGNQVGRALPGAFLAIQSDDASPRYSFSAGVAIVASVLFALGVLATRAEPALQVLCNVVALASDGAMSSGGLLWTVCIGVGIGAVSGALKIIFALDEAYLILGKYAFACILMLPASEDVTLASFDAAAVTTGDVTVPFVLSIGVGLATSVGSSDSFGILMSASVLPIITVLFVDLASKGRKALSRQSLVRSGLGLGLESG